MDLQIHEINCDMDMGQDSSYQLACINFTLFLALEKSEHSARSSGELSWKKKSQIPFWAMIRKRHACDNITGYFLKDIHPLFQSVGSGSVNCLSSRK